MRFKANQSLAQVWCPHTAPHTAPSLPSPPRPASRRRPASSRLQQLQPARTVLPLCRRLSASGPIVCRAIIFSAWPGPSNRPVQDLYSTPSRDTVAVCRSVTGHSKCIWTLIILDRRGLACLGHVIALFERLAAGAMGSKGERKGGEGGRRGQGGRSRRGIWRVGGRRRGGGEE